MDFKPVEALLKKYFDGLSSLYFIKGQQGSRIAGFE